MKISKYTKVIEIEDNKFLLYNSISNGLLEIDSETAKAIRDKNINELKNEPELFNLLRQYSIITDDNNNELNELKYKILKTKFNDNILNLTILPTLACNFNCPYCYEVDRPDVYMDKKMIQKVSDYINSYQKIEYLSIAWYGGEPLLHFPAIEEITKKINIPNAQFVASMITNGYLLNEEIADKLQSLSIKSIQITIDGPEEIHNRRRILKKENEEGTFNKIIDNIKYLFKVNKEVLVKIRINTDKTNQTYFKELYKQLQETFKGERIFIAPALVFDYDNCLASGDCLLNHQEEAAFLLDNNNVDYIANIYPDLFHLCSATHSNSFLIDPTGNLMKCLHDIGKTERYLGNINNLSDFKQQIFLDYVINNIAFDDPICKECFYLPICGGGCTYIKSTTGKRECVKQKGFIDKFIKAHYNKIIQYEKS